MYVPTNEWDSKAWMEDMEKTYHQLRTADPSAMSDAEFARLLITHVPRDGQWQFMSAKLTEEMTNADKLNTPLTSEYVLEKMKGEVERQLGENGDPTLMTAQAMFLVANSASVSGTKKRSREDSPIAAQMSTNPAKRPRLSDSPRPICSNTVCEAPVGHTIADCFAYGGGKVGQYPDWWRGPKSINLPPAQRSMANREFFIKKAAVKQRTGQTARVNAVTDTSSGSTSTSTSTATTNPARSDYDLSYFTDDSEDAVQANLSQVDNVTVLNTTIEMCSATALKGDVKKDSSFFHDTGATRHVCHDKSLFTSLSTLDNPVSINGFDSALSAVALGKGTIALHSRANGKDHRIELTEVLYVPTARVNLVSGSWMDKRGVGIAINGGKIALVKQGTVIARGELWKDLYRLHLTPISSNAAPSSLLSRIAPLPLERRIGVTPMAAALSSFNTASAKSDFYTAL